MIINFKKWKFIKSCNSEFFFFYIIVNIIICILNYFLFWKIIQQAIPNAHSFDLKIRNIICEHRRRKQQNEECELDLHNIWFFLPHLHEGQSQEISKKSKSLHEVLHEVSGKVLVSLVYSTNNKTNMTRIFFTR